MLMLMWMRCFVTGVAELQLPDLTARMPVLLFTTTTPIHFAVSVVEIVLNSHACLQMYLCDP